VAKNASSGSAGEDGEENPAKRQRKSTDADVASVSAVDKDVGMSEHQIQLPGIRVEHTLCRKPKLRTHTCPTTTRRRDGILLDGGHATVRTIVNHYSVFIASICLELAH
jgi:hypothetical protein